MKETAIALTLASIVFSFTAIVSYELAAEIFSTGHVLLGILIK